MDYYYSLNICCYIALTDYSFLGLVFLIKIQLGYRVQSYLIKMQHYYLTNSELKGVSLDEMSNI